MTQELVPRWRNLSDRATMILTAEGTLTHYTGQSHADSELLEVLFARNHLPSHQTPIRIQVVPKMSLPVKSFCRMTPAKQMAAMVHAAIAKTSRCPAEILHLGMIII